ncbi:MAG: acetoacetate--CoA ligase [Acidobacteriota bacterium]
MSADRTGTEAPAPIWSPSEERISAARITAFHQHLEDRGHGSFPRDDYLSLWRFSIDRPEAFWAEVADFCDLEFATAPRQVVDDSQRMPGADWFGGAELSFAENLLRWGREDAEPQRDALVFWNEEGRQASLSFGELRQQALAVARALEARGVGPGDRVAGFLPNLPETVVAMLGAACLGAVWSSCSPDFGVGGVLDRFGQIQPKVLFAVDGVLYGGKRIDTTARVRGIVEELEQRGEAPQVVIVPYLRSEEALRAARSPGLRVSDGDPPAPTLPAVSILWSDLLREGELEAGSEEQPLPRPMPFLHPLYILYSSGTTGLPKCMVHSAGGTLLQHLKEHALHTDIHAGDRLFYFTTCGWMMWNWLVSCLALGATAVLYDGSPFPPQEEDVLWRMAATEGVTHFGTSAKYLAMAEKKELKPRQSHDLSALRALLSTGSPLAPESYGYVYREVGEDLCLASISGGTDIVSCFLLGHPARPVWRGELQVPGLGMAVDVWDSRGESLQGEPGELVCTRAFPSMPVAFWNDPEGERYRQAYFSVYPGIWRHGDWVERTASGGFVIHGRSDATLNPGGVRIGTSEIYRQVETRPEVLESLVVGQRWQEDERIVLFLRLKEGHGLTPELEAALRREIRSGASPRHVPAVILAVDDLPRTISGKLSELAVRNILHGREVTNADALANPESLRLFHDLPQLSS